jgi:predicted RNase H-like HicB family nuclease
MDQPKYRIEIFWSDEDGGYIANVPDLRYCSAFGETYEEALREVLVAMELHLDTLRETDRPIPEPGARRGAGVSIIVLESGQAIEISEEAGEVSAQIVDGVSEAVRSTVEDVSEGAGSVVESAGEGAGYAVEEAGEGAGQVGGYTLEYEEEARRRDRGGDR